MGGESMWEEEVGVYLVMEIMGQMLSSLNKAEPANESGKNIKGKRLERVKCEGHQALLSDELELYTWRW